MDPLDLAAKHASAGARFGELAGRQVVLSRSTEGEEDAAARSQAALYDASYRDLVRVTGADRLAFLQGMLSQDVLTLGDAAWAPATLLTAKGGLVSDLNLVPLPEALLLDLEPSRGEPVKAALERFLVADDAELFSARAEWACLEVWGPRAGPALRAAGLALPEPGRVVRGERGISCGAALGPLTGARLFVPRGALLSAWDALEGAGAVPVGFERREAWRVEAGVPRFGQDMEEDTLPLEARLEASISYTKGCYLGQEVVARATYRGQLHWTLAGVALGARALPPGTELSYQGRAVGRLTSVVHSVLRGEHLGLARLRREAAEAGTELDASGHPVLVHALPF